MKKSILSLFLVAGLLVAAVGCTSAGAETTITQSTTTVTETEAKEEVAQSTEAPQAPQQQQAQNNPMVRALRAPIMRRPDEYGMDYEDIYFQATDGVTLNGWFIPGESDKLIIINHFSPANRYGYPAHLEEFANPAASGEINFLPRYKALHDAGYNIITYDMRNHGQSESANDGITGLGIHEWRDVVGSIRFAKEFDKTAGMDISLQSLCMGANSTLIAMTESPEDFNEINSLILVQPYVAETMIRNGLAMSGMEVTDELIEGIKSTYVVESRGFRFDQHDMRHHMASINVPTLMVQVRNDPSFTEENTRELYDLIEVKDKEMHWIEDTTFRFDGYQYFSDHPEKMIEWFDSHMK